MEEPTSPSQPLPLPGPSRRSPQRPVSVAVADELGFARYVHQPQAEGHQPQRGVVKFRYARNHFFHLQSAIERAWKELDVFRKQLHELAKEVEKEHFTHSDTTTRLRDLDDRLRSMVEKNCRSLCSIGSGVKSAQTEMGWLLERRGLDTEDYERSHQVLLTLPSQPDPTQKFGHKVKRAMERIRHGSFRLKPHSDGAHRSLLEVELYDIPRGNKTETVIWTVKKLTDVAGLTNCEEVLSDAEKDEETVASGHERNTEEKGDAEKPSNSAMYYVLQKLWQQHRTMVATLAALVKNLRENDEVRPRLPTTARGRAEKRMLVVGLANGVVAAESEVRAAMVQVAKIAERAGRVGTETWPELPADQRHPVVLVRSTRTRRTGSLWRFLCCVCGS